MGLSLPARNQPVSSGQAQVLGTAPRHQPQCPHFPASPTDIGVLIKGAMSICPLQPLIPVPLEPESPGEGSSSCTASLLSVIGRRIPWEAPNFGVPYAIPPISLKGKSFQGSDCCL